jgi:NitT/TauT family transport system permease protein
MATAPPAQLGPAPAGRPPDLARRAWQRNSRWLLPVIALIGLLLIWQELVDGGALDAAYVASPTSTFAELWTLLGNGGYWYDLEVSGEELVLGLGIAIVIGIVGGVLTGWYRSLRAAFQPIVNGYSAMPHIALVPVLILILGIGIWSNVAMVVLTTVPTFWITTAVAIQHIDPRFIRVARSFCATDLQFFRWVAIRAAFPNMLGALRLGTAHGLIAIVVAELYGSQAGIGHRLTTAANNYEPAEMFASLVTITFFALVINFGLGKLEKRSTAWER